MKMLIVLLILSSCSPDPIVTADSGNKDVTADLIARVDGCNIWRIYAARSVYFARCPEGARTTQWEEQQGKTSQTMFTLGNR